MTKSVITGTPGLDLIGCKWIHSDRRTQMSVTMRAVLALKPGCRLYYDCPLGGDSWKARQFFDKYRGKNATFVGYAEDLIGVLDFKGRMPGRYVDPKGLQVRFDGEETVHPNINILHFIVQDDDPAHVSLANPAEKAGCLGDLPHPILFYPGDIVRFLKKPDNQGTSDEPRKVRAVFINKPFTMDGVPRYEVMETPTEREARIEQFHNDNKGRPEGQRLVLATLPDRLGWNTTGEDIELVARGNVWALYHDPSQLSFDSDESESAFWTNRGISSRVSGSDADERGTMARFISSANGRTLEDAWRLFTAGEADALEPNDLRGNLDNQPSHLMYKLHECWAEHRERVRALTQRLWEHQVKQSAA
jgi:hypothetical protein